MEGDAEQGPLSPAQEEREVPGVEGAALELGEPGFSAARKRIPEGDLVVRPALGGVGLHRPEEIGKVSPRRNAAGCERGAEESGGEEEPDGGSPERDGTRGLLSPRVDGHPADCIGFRPRPARPAPKKRNARAFGPGDS